MHKRSHGGTSSPQLVREAAALHQRLGDRFIASIFTNRARRQRLQRLCRRAYTRFLRREVRLETQEGR